MTQNSSPWYLKTKSLNSYKNLCVGVNCSSAAPISPSKRKQPTFPSAGERTNKASHRCRMRWPNVYDKVHEIWKHSVKRQRPETENWWLSKLSIWEKWKWNFSLWGVANALNWMVATVTPLSYEKTIKLYFMWVDCMVCELYLNQTVKKNLKDKCVLWLNPGSHTVGRWRTCFSEFGRIEIPESRVFKFIKCVWSHQQAWCPKPRREEERSTGLQGWYAETRPSTMSRSGPA